MKTNLEKWNHYKRIIDARESAFVASVVNDPPKILYEVYGSGEIDEKIVTSVGYHNQKYFGFNRRPTKEVVEKIKEFAESEQVFFKERILFYYEQISSYGRSSGAVRFDEVPRYFLSKDEAEKKAAEVKEKLAQEDILLANGYTRCQRCRKVVENNKLVKSNIISFATYGRAGRDMVFCSGECAAHEQMAHEG